MHENFVFELDLLLIEKSEGKANVLATIEISIQFSNYISLTHNLTTV